MSSDTPTESPKRARKRRVLKLALVGAGAASAALLAALGVVYLNRKAAAEAVLTDWLEQRGVPAELTVERADLDSFIARVRVGPADRPDVIVDRVEVDYALGMPWSRRGLGVTPSRIRLVRPQVRARWVATPEGGRWSLGSLDGLIEDFTSRPPQPDSTSPLILVEGARVTLDTAYGVAPILADARMQDGRLMRLTARMPRTALANGPLQARGLIAAVDLTTVGDDVVLGVAATGEQVGTGQTGGQDVRLWLAARLPYPDFERQAGDGQMWTDLRLAAGQAEGAGWGGRDVSANLDFAGQITGWLQTFRLEGQANARAGGAQVTDAGGRMSGANLRLDRASVRLERGDEGLRWRIDGPMAAAVQGVDRPGLSARGLELTSARLAIGGRDRAIEAVGPVALTAAQLEAGDLRLERATARGDLDLISDGRLALNLDAAFTAAGGGWSGLGAPSVEDVPEMARLKRALGDFSLTAPSLSLRIAGAEPSVRLLESAILRPADGGAIEVTALGETPLLRGSRGGLRVVSTLPDGLPRGEVTIPDWRLTPGGFEARLDAELDLDFGLARGVSVDGEGRLASSGGRLTFSAEGCPDVGVEMLELGENDVIDLTGRLCGDARPLFDMRDGRWTAAGRLGAMRASAPFLALEVRDAAGDFTATGGPAGLALDLTVDRARVTDTTAPQRFTPLAAAGAVRLADEQWSGGFDLSHSGVTLGRMTLGHDGRTGQGGVGIDAPRIVFAEGGLQPAALSPMAADFVKSPVTGEVGFTGRIDWAEGTEGTSSGLLNIPGLDFVSPVGPVRGLAGTVEFTSLVPLTTAPDQHLDAREIEAAVMLRDVSLDFDLDKAGVMLDAGEIAVAGGRIRIEPFLIPLDPAEPIQGVVVLERVQLGDLLQETGMGDKVVMDAVVSGRLPFTRTPEGRIRIAGGRLAADQPGRLSIDRTALSGVEADGGGEEVPPNTVQDLAYQAMEHLAFETLTADVDSLEGDRMAVTFQIIGAFDPPQRQELRVTFPEFISRSFLNRTLPLPSGTGVNLTLATTLNFDQLLSDLAAVNRARRGEAEPVD